MFVVAWLVSLGKNRWGTSQGSFRASRLHMSSLKAAFILHALRYRTKNTWEDSTDARALQSCTILCLDDVMHFDVERTWLPLRRDRLEPITDEQGSTTYQSCTSSENHCVGVMYANSSAR